MLGGVLGSIEKLRVAELTRGRGSHTLWKGTLLNGARNRKVDRGSWLGDSPPTFWSFLCSESVAAARQV